MNLRDKLRDRPADAQAPAAAEAPMAPAEAAVEPVSLAAPAPAAEPTPSPVQADAPEAAEAPRAGLRRGLRSRAAEADDEVAPAESAPAAAPAPEAPARRVRAAAAATPEPEASAPKPSGGLRRRVAEAPAPVEEPVAAKKKKAVSSPLKGLPQLDVNRRFLLLAGAAAGITALLAVSFLNNSASGLSEGGTKVSVYCAKEDIKAGMKLTEDLLETREIPKAYVPTGAFEKFEKIDGRLAIAPMVAGEPLIEARTSAPNPKYGIAYLLKGGERAKTITVDSASGMAGLIKPGNEVDLIATIPDPSDSSRRIGTPILQKARVIAAGNHLLGEVRTPEEEEALSQSGGLSADGTITLAIPSGKIGVITLLEDLGNLKMVLRAAGDDTMSTSQFTDATIMALVSGKVPPKEAPKPAVRRDPPPQPREVVREVVRTVPRPAPVHHAPRPRPVEPKPAPKNTNVDVIRFGN